MAARRPAGDRGDGDHVADRRAAFARVLEHDPERAVEGADQRARGPDEEHDAHDPGRRREARELCRASSMIGASGGNCWADDRHDLLPHRGVADEEAGHRQDDQQRRDQGEEGHERQAAGEDRPAGRREAHVDGVGHPDPRNPEHPRDERLHGGRDACGRPLDEARPFLEAGRRATRPASPARPRSELLEQARLERLGSHPPAGPQQRADLDSPHVSPAAQLQRLEPPFARPAAERLRAQVDVGAAKDLDRLGEGDPVGGDALIGPQSPVPATWALGRRPTCSSGTPAATLPAPRVVPHVAAGRRLAAGSSPSRRPASAAFALGAPDDRRSIFAQPLPLKWIVGGANARVTGPSQSGHWWGPASLRPRKTSKRWLQDLQT